MHFFGYLNIMDWRANIYCVVVGDCKSACYECLATMCVGKCNPQLAVLCKLITTVLWYMVIKGYHVSAICKEVEYWFQNHCEVRITWSWCSFYHKYSVYLVTQADIYSVPSKQFEVEAASCENETAWAGNTNMYILCRYRARLVTRHGCTPPSSPKGSFFFFFMLQTKSLWFVLKRHIIYIYIYMNCGIKTILIFNVIFPTNFEPHCTWHPR